ncbi:MAG TPA: hypothetical protein DCZ91_21280 [Lachnospiraceae bacterium]|nr:hypothetical protein [Lachnospiraceae bacterium]
MGTGKRMHSRKASGTGRGCISGRFQEREEDASLEGFRNGEEDASPVGFRDRQVKSGAGRSGEAGSGLGGTGYGA